MIRSALRNIVKCIAALSMLLFLPQIGRNIAWIRKIHCTFF
uniref:Uncharacterized protein n=1 Tax=Arundo donax TaxID=35708 RepID=A0A0A9GPI9_ARUDO